MNMPHSSASWADRAAARMIDPRPVIEGQARDPLAARLLDVVNPASLRVSYQIAACDDADVAVAVRSARAAFDDGRWSLLPPATRRALLLSFARLIESHADELALDDALDMGKPISAALAEIPIAAGFIRYNAECIDKVLGGVVPTPGDCVEWQAHEPRGVVGLIVPWNFPTINAALKLGPALAAGNTVVLKPSELAPASALRLARLALEAGVPPGVFNVIPGDGVAGRALAASASVDMISFTGSTATGGAILSEIGRSTLKPTLLECGGKSPTIVFDDAASIGVRQIAATVVQDALWNGGQVCVARTRLVLQAGIYDALLEAIVEEVGKHLPGDPLHPGTTMGPLASPRQASKVRVYITQAAAEGVRPLGSGSSAVSAASGCYVAPALFVDVPQSSRLVREEIFGPVLTVQRFEEDAQAIALANATPYGLAATVWTTDLARALRLARAIRAGTVQVTGQAAPSVGGGFAHSAEPRGQSGYGVEGGAAGLKSYTALKSIRLTGS